MSNFEAPKKLSKEDIQGSFRIDLLRYIIDNFPHSNYKEQILEQLIEFKKIDDTYILEKYNMDWANHVWNLFIVNNYKILFFKEKCWKTYNQASEEDSTKMPYLIEEFTDLFQILREHSFDLFEIQSFIRLLDNKTYWYNDNRINEDSEFVAEALKLRFLLSEYNNVIKTLPHRFGASSLELQTQ